MRNRRLSLPLSQRVGFLLLYCFFAILVRSTAAQATNPSTPDSTTPRGVLKLFFSADARGDGDAIEALLLAEHPGEQDLIVAIGDQKDADRDLTGALIARFPDQWKSDPRQQAVADLPQIFARIDQAKQQIDGDTATLQASDADSTPFTLRRVDGHWRIPLAVLSNGGNAAELQNRAHQIEIQVNVMRQAAVDVKSGKYATQADAVEDVKRRIYTAALADHIAATQAATQP
ncbi:MAG TPA: hypothetical protein VL992_12620 [Tepidisphaeraceae bacterium]|nr:hypothetical protein [Tepidisphaeraceae bacterium]